MSGFAKRFRTLTADEIRFRAVERTRTAVEASRVALGLEKWDRQSLRTAITEASPELRTVRSLLSSKDWCHANSALRSHFLSRPLQFPLNPARRLELSRAIRDRFPHAAAEATRRADEQLAGRYDALGYSDVRFNRTASVPDWHFDPVHSRRAPRLFWTRVPYLEPSIGDHKIIWEINRHQHWLRFGRAAWLENDSRYADAFVRQLHDWMASNPPLVGINWTSMLELGFRTLSWIWALHFFSSFDEADETGWLVDLLVGLNRQLRHVARHLSLYFSPNTHLLGEGLALYVAGRVLPEFRDAAAWDAVGRKILVDESRRQVLPDGGHAERSMHYQRYALDFYLLALDVARRTNDASAAAFEEVVARLATCTRALADAHGTLPTLGDDDGGMLFPICARPPTDVRDSLWMAAVRLDRPDLAIGDAPEELWWMGQATTAARPDVKADDRLSQAFSDTGYVVIRTAISHAIVDVGHHGFLNGGHAHADALSFVLSAGGRPLLIDPGTATYTMDAAVRDRFRSTPMHNTAAVDGQTQSLPAGPFHWRTRTDARLLRWSPARHEATRRAVDIGRIAVLTDASGLDYLEAEHAGYAPLVHRRALVRLDSDTWLIADHLIGAGHHVMETFWHLHPDWHPDEIDGSILRHRAGGCASIDSTAGTRDVHRGDERGLGWYAPVYGQMTPATTLRFSASGQAPLSIVTVIAADRTSVPTRVEAAKVITDDDATEWHSTAAIGKSSGSTFLAIFTTSSAEAAGPGRPLHRVQLPHGEFVTDARFALLGFPGCDEPRSLDLVDGGLAIWTGDGAFTFDAAGSAANLHFDLNARTSTAVRAGR
jgi:uncharacterized heparinase superfamily protein